MTALAVALVVTAAVVYLRAGNASSPVSLRAGGPSAISPSTSAPDPSASGSPTTTATSPTTGTATGSGPGSTSIGSTAPGGIPATGLQSLAGATVVIDPGHNGSNYRHPEVINRQVDVVNGVKACDTTGTETDAGYAEHAFTWDLATRLAQVLRTAGARVILTRTGDSGVGPCITRRAAVGNEAHADLAISLHADGGPSSGVGFHVIEPGPVGPNDAIVAPSARLGRFVRDSFRSGTGEPYATYIAHNGIDVRTDLGGLNLSLVPKVFIECANMRNGTDAARVSSARWRQRAAEALAAGMAGYLATSR